MTPAPRLDLPPSENRLIALPESFGRRFLVTVDTEEEFDWSLPFARDAHDTAALGALPHFQSRMEEAGVRPLYLVDHAVASDPRATCLADWARRGIATVGAHMHPWTTPPCDEALSGPSSFAGNLPRALERAKIVAVTEALEALTGERPNVFRAGRYGVGPNTAAILVELGYTIDVSVRSRFDYGREQGPRFTRFPPIPWWISPGELLEIPLSGTFAGRAFAGPGRPGLNALLKKLGLLERLSLTPEGVSVASAKAAVLRLLDEDVRLFSLFFHSPSLEPGHTPYVRTPAMLERFWAWWSEMFDFFSALGIAPIGIEEAAAACVKAEGEGEGRLPGRPATSAYSFE